jgi:hypothetical protein
MKTKMTRIATVMAPVLNRRPVVLVGHGFCFAGAPFPSAHWWVVHPYLCADMALLGVSARVIDPLGDWRTWQRRAYRRWKVEGDRASLEAWGNFVIGEFGDELWMAPALRAWQQRWRHRPIFFLGDAHHPLNEGLIRALGRDVRRRLVWGKE